jgi:hypothetical protein
MASVGKTMWKNGMEIVAWILLIIVLIPLGLAAVALLIGLCLVLLGISPALLLVWFLGIGILMVDKRLGWRSFFCYYCDRRAKRLDDLYRARLDEKARARREKAAERLEQIFADLEKGYPLPQISEAPLKVTEAAEIQTVGEFDVEAQCLLDTRLPRGQILAVFLLPIVHNDGMAYGLLLHLADGKPECYSRVGWFSATYRELEKLPRPSAQKRLWLV